VKRGLVAAALLLAGCAGGVSSSGPGSPDRLLQRADDQLVAAQYKNALTLYDEYLQAHPNEPVSPRVRTARTAVERLLVSQGEVERLRREVDGRQGEIDRLRREQDTRQGEIDRLRREQDTRQGEIDRLRRERDTRQAEIERLKADLERLRRIDLRPAPVPR